MRIRIEICRGLTLNPGIQAILCRAMSEATMAGLVYEPAQGILSLCSVARIHDGIWQWMARLLSIAAMLQLEEARLLGAELALQGAGDPACHPRLGVRKMPAPLAAGFIPMLEDAGRWPCQWRDWEFASALEQVRQGAPALASNGGGLRLGIEFPCGRHSAPCEFAGGAPYERIGRGLRMIQRFPGENLPRRDLLSLAMELNEKPIGYGFGSFCAMDDAICFSGFLPNLAYRPGLLPHFLLASADRAAAMGAIFASQNPRPRTEFKRGSASRRWWGG